MRARGLSSLRAGYLTFGAILLATVISFLWTPFDPTAIIVEQRLAPPSLLHPLGTDQLGRDVVSLLMAGGRTSIAVALVAVGVGIGLGVPLGLLAAAAQGLPDELLMRVSDIVFAFPALLLAILLTAVLGPSATNAILAIGIFNIPIFARLTRGEARALWHREFVMAARLSGKSRFHISVEHILPNLAPTLIVQATIQFSLGVLAEAGLSYVGLGAQPPVPSWGRMLSEAQTYVALAPWLVVAPGLAIALTVLSLNLLGDGLNDLLDPKAARS